jgi:hypothetical protein
VSVLNFKPAIWSKVILAALQKNLVFGSSAIVNDDYEGEISGPGTSVRITQFGDPSISDYTPGGTISYQQLEDAGLELLIDQSKSFSFAVDDVDKAQAAGNMQTYLEGRASYKLADTMDQFIASLYTGVAAANILQGSGGSSIDGSPLAPATYDPTSHPADFYLKVLLPLKVALDEANVPKTQRYAVMPPWAEALLEQTQAFISVTDMQGDPSKVFTEGFIGRAAGFDLYCSNNAVEIDTSDNGTYVVQAGHPMAITAGDQIMQTEALRLQNQFADGVRGLHVYGAKLVRPDCIAVAGVARPTGI